MRKIFLTSLLVLLGIALVSGSAYALSGVCSNCHTMHNSQNGLGEVQTYAGGVLTSNVATPQDYLLKADCIACHTKATAGQTNSFNAPVVLHIANPTDQGGGFTNAGGDFYWVATGLGVTPSKGHNVAGLAAQEAAPMNVPPGWDLTATAGFTFGQVTGGANDWANNQLTCAGTYGCHGQHNATGITGAHHSNNGTNGQCSTATTTGNSFRFLSGIKGLENSDWNWTEAAGTHNEYYGVADTAGRDALTYTNKDTISFSCAECHGIFHATIASGAAAASPWLRHPTDIVLPDTVGNEYSAYTNYSVEAPVARPTIPASSIAAVDAGDSTNDDGAIVMCLSCHRAHGSPEPDLLRWTYSGMVANTTGAGAGTGCFTCHTTKDGV